MTILSTIFAVVVACGLMGILGDLAYLMFRHDHPNGESCGWSGCQAKSVPVEITTALTLSDSLMSKLQPYFTELTPDEQMGE